MSLKAIDEKPIIDAKRSMLLHITANDVEKADAKEPMDCAVARACRRELHVKEVRVHLARIYIRTSDGNWTRYFTTRSMRTEIIAFDRGGTFAPGDYHLQAPYQSQKLGKRRGSTKKYPKRNKKRMKPHVVTDVRMGPA